MGTTRNLELSVERVINNTSMLPFQQCELTQPQLIPIPYLDKESSCSPGWEVSCTLRYTGTVKR